MNTDSTSSVKVLLVDDNALNRDVESRMLVKVGAQVDAASSGQQAIDWFKEKAYDLIIMDWQMPLMSGQEATALIRASEKGAQIPIIALSGHVLPGDRQEILAQGFSDFMSKPVRMDDFRKILSLWSPHL